MGVADGLSLGKKVKMRGEQSQPEVAGLLRETEKTKKREPT